MKQLWKHQDFAGDLLRTADNKKIQVLLPGKPNFDSGPDFLNAKIRIGGILYRGDVELHTENIDWVKHSHHKDPKYNSVILHVVFKSTQIQEATKTVSEREIPVLFLEHYLTSSFRELWEKMILDERSERLATIKCYDHNAELDSAIIQRWLNKLSIERIELKMRRFDERLKELIDEQKLFLNEPPRFGEIPFGINPEDLPIPVHSYTSRELANAHLWEQLLYEGFMEALGYSKNQEPFLKLARNVRLQWLAEILNSPRLSQFDIEAILFGVAGLLLSPKRVDDAESKAYVTGLQAQWKSFQKMYRNDCCDESEWQFFRLRPDNFPTVRIAGAATIVANMLKKRLLKSLVQILKRRELNSKEKYKEIVDLFTVNAQGFWEHHYRFGERAKKDLMKLIGTSRADEIVQNVVVPICFLYARIFKDKDVRKATLDMYENCLPASENSILRTIDEQLIKEKFKMKNAKLQQGALQLYKFYCVEEKCGECAVGKNVFVK